MVAKGHGGGGGGLEREKKKNHGTASMGSEARSVWVNRRGCMGQGVPQGSSSERNLSGSEVRMASVVWTRARARAIEARRVT